MTASFNSMQLLSVKSELDSSLAKISLALESFFATGSDTESLESALSELHRFTGVLQMLPMRGLVVFCTEFETLLKELSSRPQDASPMRQDAIRRALFGLTHYLDAIAAVVIGGTSLAGGVGTITGTLIGAFIMSVLINGLRIMSVAQEWQMVLTGLIIIVAVYTDNLRNKRK